MLDNLHQSVKVEKVTLKHPFFQHATEKYPFIPLLLWTGFENKKTFSLFFSPHNFIVFSIYTKLIHHLQELGRQRELVFQMRSICTSFTTYLVQKGCKNKKRKKQKLQWILYTYFPYLLHSQKYTEPLAVGSTVAGVVSFLTSSTLATS